MSRLHRPTLAGSAVLEGVVLRSEGATCVAVRRPSGEVVTRLRMRRTRPLTRLLTQIPVVRGWVGAGAALVHYAAAFFFAVSQADLLRPLATAAVGAHPMPAHRPARRRRWAALWTLSAWLFWSLLGLVLVLGGVPVIFADLAQNWAQQESLQGTLGAAGCRVFGVIGALGLMTGYVSLVGHTRAMSRLLVYHGAEHRVRAAYEAGLPLTLMQVRHVSAHDAHCVMGRGVVLVLMGFILTSVLACVCPPLAAILAHADKSYGALLAAVSLRALAVVLATGFYGELARLADKYNHEVSKSLLRGPGRWLCAAAVVEPNDQATEVALAALLRLLDPERVDLKGHRFATRGYGKLVDACMRTQKEKRCETN